MKKHTYPRVATAEDIRDIISGAIDNALVRQKKRIIQVLDGSRRKGHGNMADPTMYQVIGGNKAIDKAIELIRNAN